MRKKFINIEVVSNQKVVDKFLKQKGIKTTIKVMDLSKEVLENRIRYVKINNSYKKLALKFTKNRLVKKILKELK